MTTRKIYKRKNLWKRVFQNVSLEEVIKPIYRNFIEPFVQNQPMSPQDMIRIWFDTDNRDVFFAMVKKEILIPGFCRHPDNNQDFVPEVRRREARKNDHITVRFDNKRPAFVEVEFNELVFIMRADQYAAISGSIALVG